MHDNSNAIGELDEMKKKTLKVPFISLLNNDNRIFHHHISQIIAFVARLKNKI